MATPVEFADVIKVILTSIFTAIPIGVGFVWAIKSDTKVLRSRMDGVDRQLEKMDNVLVVLAENKGRMERMDDRAVLQGSRIDDLTKRFNQWADRQLDRLDPDRSP